MKRDSDQPDQPLRSFPAHYGMAVLAVAGALALQSAWPILLHRQPATSWWPLDAMLIVAATGYLLATAWGHCRAAAWRANSAADRIWRIGSGIPGDVLLAAIAGVLLVRGAETTTFRAGLAIVPTVLLSVGALSAVVGLLAMRRGLLELGRDVPLVETSRTRPRIDAVRSIAGILLLLAIALLEGAEPRAKPWDVSATNAVGQSSP